MTVTELREQQKERVLSCIHHGRDLANSRLWISIRTGLGDRHVRQIIEELRRDGYLICNDQTGGGYYLAETDDEIRRQYHQDMARAISILKRVKPFKAAVDHMDQPEDQVTFEDVIRDVFFDGSDQEWQTN